MRGIKDTARLSDLQSDFGQGDPVSELAEIRSHLEPQIMLQVWMTKPELDPGEQARQLIEEIRASNVMGAASRFLLPQVETAPLVLCQRLAGHRHLGIIPRGTANAFSVALGIPTD